MTDYKAMYYNLAGVLADVIENLDKMSESLKEIQRRDEESLIEDKETSYEEMRSNLKLLKK